MIDTLKALCALPGVSGDEGAVRDYISNRVKQHADGISVDALGNLIVRKNGKAKPAQSLLVCAHMDEVGVIVTEITDEGFLKFQCVGGIDRRVLPGKLVYFGLGKTPGIIGMKPEHLQKKGEADKSPEVDELYVDIGAKDRQSAEKSVEIGETGVFDAAVFEFGDGFLKAKAIDDRFGCAVMIKLIEEGNLPFDATFAFHVQEEVGLRGAVTSAYSVNPDIALIIEATTAADFPGAEPGKQVCALGAGAVIPFMDGGTVYDKELTAALKNIAEQNGIKHQTKRRVAGGTDAASVQRSRAGVRVCAVSAPVRNLHSPACVAKISDLQEVYAIVRLFVLGGAR